MQRRLHIIPTWNYASYTPTRSRGVYLVLAIAVVAAGSQLNTEWQGVIHGIRAKGDILERRSGA